MHPSWTAISKRQCHDNLTDVDKLLTISPYVALSIKEEASNYAATILRP